jgi:hypothetical protein
MNEPLKTYEIKQLKFFNKIFDNSVPNFNNFERKLKDYDYTSEELAKYFRLYVNNFREDAKYELIEEPDRSLGKLANTINDIIKNPKMDYDEIMEILTSPNILGDWFDKGKYGRNDRYVDYDKEGLELYMDNSDWEKYFSGLDEHDTHYLALARTNYNRHEEADNEEFEYLSVFTDEVRDNIVLLAKLLGDFNFAKEVENNQLDQGDFKNFLEKYFPEEVDSIIDEYLYDYGYALFDVRAKSVEKCYEDEIKFDGKGRADIFIPWGELLKLLTSNADIMTLSDLKDIEINGEISLEDCWFNSDPPSTEDLNDTYYNLNRHIEKLIEKIEDEEPSELSNRATSSKNIWDLIEKLGFRKEGKILTKKTKNGIVIKIMGVNIDDETVNIEITYPKEFSKSKWSESDKEIKKIPYQDLSTWLTTIPLERQTETRKIIEKILKESFKTN